MLKNKKKKATAKASAGDQEHPEQIKQESTELFSGS